MNIVIFFQLTTSLYIQTELISGSKLTLLPVVPNFCYGEHQVKSFLPINFDSSLSLVPNVLLFE